MTSTLARVGTAPTCLGGVALSDGRLVDVVLAAGSVADVVPPGSGPAEGRCQLPGWLLLPAFAEPHAHLDKAFTWARAGRPLADLGSAIAAWHGIVPTLGHDDVVARATRGMRDLLAAGCTAVRTHVDVLPGPHPLLGVEALATVKAAMGDAMDLQVTVLPDRTAPRAAVDEALATGAVDVIGGCPHLGPDPAGETAYLAALAARHDLQLDLHTDEDLDPLRLSITDLVTEVRRLGLAGRAVASHCVSLGAQPDDVARRIAGDLADAGVAVVTLPLTNLALQGRDRPVGTPRALPPLRLLREAGVVVAAGGDNVRDPFNPLGRGDPLDTAGLLVAAGHLSLEAALACISSDARRVLGLSVAGPWRGAVADLVAVQAPTLADAIAGAATGRLVLRRGRVVAGSLLETRYADEPAA